jgi:hypothetical protein
MRIEVIFCQVCNYKLRIPEDLMGRPVQCPECKSVFIAPPPSAPQSDEPASTPEHRDRPAEVNLRAADFDRMETPESDSDGKVMAPAFTLLAIAFLGALFDVIELLFIIFKPNAVKQAIAGFPFPLPAGIDMITMQIVIRSIFLVVSLAVAAGAAAMMNRKMYPLAILGSFAAICNFGHCCCILGAPAGIWALIVLFQPDVRESFR